MTGAQIALYLGIATPLIGGGGYTAKLVGDTIWLPIDAYRQEKLYDLQDEADEFADRQMLGETLTPLDELNKKRLLRRIDRLQKELE